MIGKQDRWQEDLFVACPLGDLIPEDHILKRVDKVLDLSWVRKEVRNLYDESMGRPSIDPEAALRLMLAGLFQGIVHDRKLMREAQVNIAIRWFAGYRLHEQLPDHSSLTRIRQRWGPDGFRRVFQKTVRACLDAGLIDGETIHVDATLIRADVSWESLVERHVEQVLEENVPEDDPPTRRRGRPRKNPKKPKKYSRTDPEATLTTNNKAVRMEPSYKQHTAVDDKAGVILDVEVSTGEASEGEQLIDQIERIETNTGRKVKAVTADAAYAHSINYARLENRGTDGVIPPQSEPKKPKCIPLRRFKYDSRGKIVRCPAGRVLRRSHRGTRRWIYRARACDCRDCPLRSRCVPPSGKVRTIGISDGYEALLRARRRKAKGWDEQTRQLYCRHRWRSEGIHGEGKKWHGLGRAIRRGLWNVAIQAFLTAAVMNLKRLAGLGSLPKAAAVGAKALIEGLFSILHRWNCCKASHFAIRTVQLPIRRDFGTRTQSTAKAA